MDVQFDEQGFPAFVRYPKYLFKFISSEERFVDTIRESYLWFSSPSEFNDPFEARNMFTLEYSEDHFKTFSTLLAARNRQAALRFRARLRKDPDFLRKMADGVFRDTMETLFACCCSATAGSVLMWSHYANAHKGACVVLDMDWLMYVAQVGARMSSITMEYTDHPRKISFIDYYGQKLTPESNYTIRKAFVGFKTRAWSYEQEVRLLASKPGRNAFDPRALVGVIAGARTTPAFQDRVRELLSRRRHPARFALARLNEELGSVDVPEFTNSFIEKDAIALTGDPGAVHTTFFAKTLR